LAHDYPGSTSTQYYRLSHPTPGGFIQDFPFGRCRQNGWLSRQLQKISLPDPVDPFGKASGRDLLTMALSILVHFPEFTSSGFGLHPLHVNKTRHLKP
jgi:hypothetical protein